MRRRGGRPPGEEPGSGGLGGFLRSLLAGVPWSERAEGESELKLPVPRGRSVRIHNANGRTVVLGEEREDVLVRAEKTARAESAAAAEAMLDEIRVVHQAGSSALDLEVEVPSRWNRRGYANLEIRVPRGFSVEVSASNGKVVIESLRGSVRARSSNGAVHIGDVVGDIEVATSNARVSSCGTCGRLVARSSNGKIELQEHSGSIDASTSNGLIRASLETMGKEGVELSTSNGRIVLELPEELDAEVDIRVDNGVIRNDRPLCKAIRERQGQLKGRIGNGGAAIRLRTSNGSVTLR